jgi:hypothetical protein
MSSTRKINDEENTKLNLQRDTNIGRYMLNCPGNGLSPNYIDDPHIRLQKWGANNVSNMIDINNDLRGLNRPLNRETDLNNTYNKQSTIPDFNNYASINSITDESRSIAPAWELRDLERKNTTYLHLNPQERTEVPFVNNVSTRIIEKDNFSNFSN